MTNLLQTEVERLDPDVAVVHMSGKLVLGPDCAGLEKLTQELLGSNQKKVVFDMAGVAYIDSTGMGVIVSCLSTVRKGGGELRLAAVPDRLRNLFKITRLDTVLAFYPTVLAAAESFAGPVGGSKT